MEGRGEIISQKIKNDKKESASLRLLLFVKKNYCNNLMLKNKQLKGLEFNEPLAKYTTFKIGGRAKYFFVAKNEKELIKALMWAKEKKVPYFILGGGSNLLVSDKGFKGLVIKCQMSNVKCQNQNSTLKTIKVDGGVSLSKLVSLAAKKGFSGLEWAAGIPGTVGGVVCGNAGAFGSCVAEVVESIKVLTTYNLQLTTYNNKNCKFSYRNSIFKNNKNLIILSVELQLRKGNKTEIQKKVSEYLNYRKKIQPLNSSAGCVFKNIEIANLKNKNTLEIIPEKKIKGGKLPAGYLIEKVGLRGKRQSQAQISKKHANFIVNLGGAKAKDVIYLINLTKRKVKKKFGVELKEEIQYIGFR